MRIGIIGPAGAGKSTVFECLTGVGLQAVPGRETTVGVVRVPDPRLDVLSALYNPKKTTPAEIVFVDTGTSASASGKLSALTGALADCDALAIVVGGFSGEDPVGALESFLLDLTLADLSVVETRLERIEKDVQRGRKDSAAERPLMERLQAALEQGQRVASVAVSPEEDRMLRGYQFITRKPALVLANVAEKDLGNGVGRSVLETAATVGLPSFELCAPLEQEISRLPEGERQAFLEDFGLTVAARDRFIRAAYDLVDLISFFTVGPDEVRAWSVRRGTLAPQAAGKIHSDIERGFIRAEVVAYDDLTREGSHQACRSKGLVRLEGNTYEVKDGDVIEFRFSV